MTDYEIIVLFAVRYALPRTDSTAPMTVRGYLAEHAGELSAETRQQLQSEILSDQRLWSRTDAERDWAETLAILTRDSTREKAAATSGEAEQSTGCHEDRTLFPGCERV